MSLEIVEFLKKVISLLVNVAPWTVVIFAFAIFYPKFRGIRRGPLRKTLLACFIVLVPLFFLMVSYFVQFTFWEAINWLLPLIACLPWCAVCLWLWLVFCKFGSFWKGFQNKFTLILASFFFAAVIFSLAIELAQPFDLQRYPERNTLLGHLALSLQLAFRDAFHILSGDGEELYALVQEIQFRTPGYKVTVWILSVTLPLLTVSYLLSTVSILWEILSIGNPRNQKFYIFSEANAQSICMAHSIHEREKKKKPIPHGSCFCAVQSTERICLWILPENWKISPMPYLPEMKWVFWKHFPVSGKRRFPFTFSAKMLLRILRGQTIFWNG